MNNSIFRKLLDNPIYVSLAVLFVLSLIVIFLTASRFVLFDRYTTFGFYDPDFYVNVLVEAHGMLLDIVVFGVIILLLDISRNRRSEIKRYKEEIEDFRFWQEKEAMHRLRGIVRRLNKSGITSLLLNDCYFENADLQYFNLNSSILGRTNMRNSRLEGATLENAVLSYTDLREAGLRNTNLSGAILNQVKLDGAAFFNVDLSNAILHRLNFRTMQVLESPTLEGAIYDDNTQFPEWLDQDYRDRVGMVKKMNLSQYVNDKINERERSAQKDFYSA